jgi:hypothetical protein
MPATFKKLARYVAPDGKEFETLHDEQEHEIACMIPEVSDPEMPTTCETWAAWIVGNARNIIACLIQRERKHATSEAKPRKKRTAKGNAAPAAPTA